MNNPLKLNLIVRARTSTRNFKASKTKRDPSVPPLEPTMIRIKDPNRPNHFGDFEAVSLWQLQEALKGHESLTFEGITKFETKDRTHQLIAEIGHGAQGAPTEKEWLTLVNEKGKPITSSWWRSSNRIYILTGNKFPRTERTEDSFELPHNIGTINWSSSNATQTPIRDIVDRAINAYYKLSAKKSREK